MAEIKTKKTEESVEKFINSIENEKKRNDCFAIIDIMKQATKQQPKMWGTSIVGFGSYHYKYESGHEGDMCIVGFSPRKQNISLYINIAGEDKLLEQLGKHKTGKGCLYINTLEDIKTTILKEMIKKSFDAKAKKYSQ